jgi:hypothetical protein
MGQVGISAEGYAVRQSYPHDVGISAEGYAVQQSYPQGHVNGRSGAHATAASWTIGAPQGSLNRDGPIPAPLKDKGERRARERESENFHKGARQQAGLPWKACEPLSFQCVILM